MRKAAGKMGTALAVSALVASAGVAASQARAGADPATHQVRYTVTSAATHEFDLYYLTAQPASKAAYNADAYAFVKQEKVTVAPDAPWVFETTLADPQWAILTVSSTNRRMEGSPSATCDITVDGQVAAHDDNPYTPQCRLGQW